MLYFSILLLCLCLLTIGCYSQTFSNFAKETLCDATEKLAKGCSSEQTGVRSFIQCLSLCGRNVSCIGASLDGEGKCFLHVECRQEVGECSTPDMNHHYMAKHCVHGTWDVTSQMCNCFNAFHGDRCDKYHQNCLDFKTAGNAPGLHAIYIDPEQDGNHPVPVFCALYTSDYFKTILMRSQGLMNFNRSWEEYRKGFYSDGFNFWAGLDSLHHLTNAGYDNILFILRMQPTSSVYRVYNDFVVSSGNLNYRVTFSDSYDTTFSDPPPGISFGDCLGPIKDKPFSTWDRDNDGDGSLNCASRAGSGWWYSGCDNPCNLLGYGFEYWASTPSYQHFSVLGVDMNQLEFQFDYFEITYTG